MIRVIKRDLLIKFVSFVFSTSLIVSVRLFLSLSSGTEETNHKLNFTYFDLIFAIILSIVLYFLLIKIISNLAKKKIILSKSIWNKRIIFLLSFISTFLSGLLFLLTFYPGVATVDSVQLLADPVGYSFQYPLIYSLIQSKLFYLLYDIFNSMNVAFFLLSLLQLIFMSSIISYTISWFHVRFKSNTFTMLIILYFNLFLVFSNINVAHLRDSYFAAFFLLLITVLYQISKTNGKCFGNDSFMVKCILIITGLLCSRNNAVFTVLFLLIILLNKYRIYIQRILILLGITIFVCIIPNFIPNNMSQSLCQESMAVPIQQISYTIKYGNISERDKEVISDIIPADVVSDKYRINNVDNIKWYAMFDHFGLNAKINSFVKIWLKNMIPNFKCYVKAYILHMSDLFTIQVFKTRQSVFFEIDKDYFVGNQYFRELNNISIFPNFIQSKLEWFYKNYTVYVNNGSLFWIYVFLAILLIYKNKKQYLIVFVPFGLIWANLMIASPLAGAFRYMSMFGYALPFIVGIVFQTDK